MDQEFDIISIGNIKFDTSILIIYTGGTFGMGYDKNGQLSPFDFESVLEKIPELNKLGLNISVYSFPSPVDSSNIESSDWQLIGQVIFSNYDHYDGFVVLHGTDTMAYSASALSFMLKNLAKPVIFTGAQIPIGATRSDARENLITALEFASVKFAGEPAVQEVCIYFNHILLRGNRAQKIRSSNFGAFESENYPLLAEAGVEIRFNESCLYKPEKESKLEFFKELDNDAMVLKIFPNMSLNLIEGILQIKNLKGLVLESFGSGNVMNHNKFVDLLEAHIYKGLIVLNVSQCSGGSVNHGRYATSGRLSQIGVLSGHDMTTEAAITKMMFLLAKENSLDIVKAKLSASLRGELTVL
ncbi:MAG: asparaginase [Reichenbachiella sp.]